MMQILEQFNGLNVLVVGDVMIDAYYFGKVERISPEAPVPVVAVKKKENRLGGAANVAMNLVALGAKPTVCSVVGNDKDGDDLIQLFQHNGVSTNGIVKSDERVTTVKLRVISQATQMLRIDTEETKAINNKESAELVERISVLLKDADVLIFEDYDKGVLTKENIAQITAEAKKNNVPVVVDPKKRNFKHYHYVDLFKPNLKELKEGLNIDFDAEDTAAFEDSIKQMMEHMHLKHAMITMSERGVMITDGKTFNYIPAHIRKIADVSGAGDTVISIAALCFALKLNMKDTAALSNLAGGLVCEEVGVVPIDKLKLTQEVIELGL
ncbi:carbohydrate kinase [Bacteroidetes bacterium UKL13-3]|jgi:rfaE bifunctional protein kinase chain/domain|nr:carbohydrate kinase [Bacteroidetes bacterium UKL13-3]HCP94352.1 D-glycero-beta-D-manno-heptose-7-phosphate kinase [Bacteroidota bacterium]